MSPAEAQPSTRRIAGDIGAVVEEWLRPYLDQLDQRRTGFSDKVLNDCIWGSIRLLPWEVALLDSPVIQRLRGLRQLGVVHWVYPGAGHSRLEHTLGVVHQVQSIVDGIERNSGRAGAPILSDRDVKLLRLTGLLHDCGHVVMSHVGEQVFSQLPGLSDLARAQVRDLGIHRDKKPSTSEVVAATIVRTPAFRELLGHPRVGADFVVDPVSDTDEIARLILGGAPRTMPSFAAGIISGPYDADKLDYMTRDAFMAGIPSAVDVGRLVEKIHVVEITPGSGSVDAQSYHRRTRLQDGSATYALALPVSARAVLEEIAAARAWLYVKVYRHQKVRALEWMARRALGERGWTTAAEWLRASDEQVIDQGAQTPHSLRWRRTPKRALTLEPPPLADEAGEQSAGNPSSMDELWGELLRRPAQDRLETGVRHEVERVCRELGRTVEPTAVVCDFVDWDRMELDRHAFIGDTADNLVMPRPQARGQRSKYAEAATRVSLIIFAPDGLLDVVATVALDALTGIVEGVTRQEIEQHAVYDAHGVYRVRRDLKALGKGELPPPRPRRQQRALEEFFRNAWTRIDQVGSRFAPYQGADGGPLGPAAVVDFLRQFGDVGLARSMLRVLEHTKLRGRPQLSEMVHATLTAREQAGACVGAICPLGSVADSSTWLSYFVGDLGLQPKVRVWPVELSLELDQGTELVLWDDFCGRGGHAVTTLYQWSDGRLPEPDDLLREDLADPLSPDRWDAIRQRPVKIAFALGRPSGVDAVRRYVEASGLENVEVLDPVESVPDADGFLDDGSVLSDPDRRARLKAFLQDKARQVLTHRLQDGDWHEDKLEDRLLGYGNLQHRIVFFYNVPSVTLTLLWYDRQPDHWRPLFPRRTKPSTA